MSSNSCAWKLGQAVRGGWMATMSENRHRSEVPKRNPRPRLLIWISAVHDIIDTVRENRLIEPENAEGQSDG
jgi:hypothetical protein